MSNSCVPSTEAMLLRRKTLVSTSRLKGAAMHHPEVTRRMHEVISAEMEAFCGKADHILQVALAGVSAGREAEAVDLKLRQQQEMLLYSSLLEGTRPWEVLSGTTMLPSYAALHPIEEIRELASDDVPRELLAYFVDEQ